MDYLWLILVLGAGLIASAFFSGMETGLISLNRLRLRHEVENQNRRARIIHSFVENSERLLGTTLAGTNLSNVVVGVVGSALMMRWWGEHYVVDIVTTLLIGAIVLVIGEITPKLLFRQYSHRLCLTFADVLNAAAWLLAPLVWFLGLLMRGLARLSGRGDAKPATFFVSREELKHLAKEGEVGGALTPEERQMIHGVFDFPYKTVQEVMIPLNRVVTVAPATGWQEISDISQRTGYARLPVRDGDKIIGVVNVYEILFQGAATAGQTARDLMQKPQFVLATDRVNRVLPVLRASRNPISIVLNPAGRALGIITIEDIVEEIVGDVEG
jgi:CBS domain containing-hemolysin-like protein